MKILLFSLLILLGCSSGPGEPEVDPMRYIINEDLADPMPGESLVQQDAFDNRIRNLPPNTPKQAVASNIAEWAKKGAWSGNNQLGREAAFDPDANNRQTILKLDEWGFPEVWTVALGMSFTPIVSQIFFVKAEVDIGAGGTTQKVVMDWENGTVFSAPMNALQIIALYGLASGHDVPPDLVLRVTLSRGSARPGCIPPKFQNQGVQLVPAGAESISADIPAFARGANVMMVSGIAGATPFSATNYLRFYADEAATILIAQVRADALAFAPYGYPIPNGAYFTRYFNGGADQINIRTVYYLAF